MRRGASLKSILTSLGFMQLTKMESNLIAIGGRIKVNPAEILFLLADVNFFLSNPPFVFSESSTHRNNRRKQGSLKKQNLRFSLTT